MFSTPEQQGGQTAVPPAPSFLRAQNPTQSVPVASTPNHPPPGSFSPHTSPPSWLEHLVGLQSDAWRNAPPQFMSLPPVSAVSVMGGLPPIPGYLVAAIERGEFVDFMLLRLCNIAALPTVPPSSVQLDRLLKTLPPIATFED
eukprot:gene8678-biopygen6952